MELVLQPESMESLSSYVLPWELFGNKPEVVLLKYMTVVTLGVSRTFLLLTHRAHPQRETSAVWPSKVSEPHPPCLTSLPHSTINQAVFPACP